MYPSSVYPRYVKACFPSINSSISESNTYDTTYIKTFFSFSKSKFHRVHFESRTDIKRGVLLGIKDPIFSTY